MRKQKEIKHKDFVYPICLTEERPIDGFDLIAICGLMKEYNRHEIWKRYLPAGAESNTVSAYVSVERYFIEMHVEQMHRIILSEKFNTNPFSMQQVVQRICASHDHDLIMEKIRAQGIDTGENPISLACSMGNTIIDLIVHKNESFPNLEERPHGRSSIEIAENRPIDMYDFSSLLYLCQQNQTEQIFRRYGPEEEQHVEPSERRVHLTARLGDYQVALAFYLIRTDEDHHIQPPGNASVGTIHEVLQRMNFRHPESLISKELNEVGLSVRPDQVRRGFMLRRHINNTCLSVEITGAGA